MKLSGSRSIKFRVVALTAIIIAPLLIVFALIAFNLAATHRAMIELQRKNMVHELSSRVDRDFMELKGMLVGIAVSLPINKFDKTAINKQMATTSRFGQISAMWSFSPNGNATEQLMDVSPTSAAHNLSKELLLRVFGGESAVSGVSGEGMENASIVIAVPVFGQNNTVVSGVAAEVSVSFFIHAFDDTGMEKNWVAAVVDRNGHFVARSLESVRRVGTAARSELTVVARGTEASGTFENVTLEGVLVSNSYQRSPLTNWTSVMAVPKAELAAPLQYALTYTSLVGFSALALSTLAATVMAARIAVPVTNLSRYASALAEGRIVEQEQYHITEIETVRTSLNQAMVKSARLATIVSSSGDAIIGVGLDGKIQDWNKAAERIFDYTVDEIIGKPNSTLVPNELQPEFDAQRPQILAGEVVRAESVRVTKSGQKIDVEFVDAPIIDSFGNIAGYSTTIRDISERISAGHHRQLLMQELAHRTKNQLAIIQSIAQQTKRNATTLEDFISAFNGRIQGLAASHDILAKQQWKAIPLRELVKSQIGVLVSEVEKMVAISGPDIALTAAHAESLGLALHELTTNSLKYGALSVVDGQVSVSWHVTNASEPLQVFFEWQESGGPKIKKRPAREGFGSKVLNTITAVSLGGEAQTEFRTVGLYWRVAWELAS
jgi:PAS domain S-box-containing protein